MVILKLKDTSKNFDNVYSKNDQNILEDDQCIN